MSLDRIEELTRQLEQSEKSERLALAKADAVIRAARAGGWEWVIDDDELRWDARMWELWGIDPDERGYLQFNGHWKASYDAFIDGVHPGDRDAVNAAVARSYQDGEPYLMQCRVVRPDGSCLSIVASGETHRSPDGAPERMIGVCLEIGSCDCD